MPPCFVTKLFLSWDILLLLWPPGIKRDATGMPTYREGAVGKVAPMKEIAYLPKSQRLLKEKWWFRKKNDLICIDHMTPSWLMEERVVIVTSNIHTDFQIVWFRTTFGCSEVFRDSYVTQNCRLPCKLFSQFFVAVHWLCLGILGRSQPPQNTYVAVA